MPEQFSNLTVAIDKLDKIGWEGVAQELEQLQVDAPTFEKVKAVLQADDLATIKMLFQEVPIGLEGVQELEQVYTFLEGYDFKNKLQLDFSLARGLSYYTGCIFEVVVDTSVPAQAKVKMGSIGGGGRYADLTGIFDFKDMSGVGVSFGAERIFDVLEQLELFQEIEPSSTKLLFLAMDDAALRYGFDALRQVRAVGIASAIYPKAWKFPKLMKYADKVQVPYVVLIGSKELESGQLGFKNMTTGEQQELSLEAIIEALR